MNLLKLRAHFAFSALTALLAFVACPTEQASAQPVSAVPAETGQLDSPDSQSNSQANKKPILQGGVKHSEALPGLEENLKPGQVYSDDLLMKAGTQTNNEWYYIPAWYAGVRHAEDNLIVYRFDYETGEATTPMQKQLNRQDSLSGYQRDKNGGIWDFKRVPRIQHVESDFVNAVLYVKKITPITGNEDRIVIKYDEISISISKKNHKITQVVQQEQINTISSPQPGVVRVDVSVKSFDWDGTPQRLEQAVMMSKITKPFEQIDQYEGQDLRPLFRDYLISHNLENLVPDDLRK